MEEYVYKTGKAHISVIEIEQNGDYKKPQIVLEKEYHLSYPFVFENRLAGEGCRTCLHWYSNRQLFH